MLGPFQEKEIKKRMALVVNDHELYEDLILYYNTFYTPRKIIKEKEGDKEKLSTICGVPNKYGKPCSRIGKCPFHSDKNSPNIVIKKSKKVKRKKGWTRMEHLRFLKGMQMYGRTWNVIAKCVGTKNSQQIQSHANRYYQRQEQEDKYNKSVHDFNLEKLGELEIIFGNILKSIPSEQVLQLEDFNQRMREQQIQIQLEQLEQEREREERGGEIETVQQNLIVPSLPLPQNLMLAQPVLPSQPILYHYQAQEPEIVEPATIVVTESPNTQLYQNFAIVLNRVNPSENEETNDDTEDLGYSESDFITHFRD